MWHSVMADGTTDPYCNMTDKTAVAWEDTVQNITGIEFSVRINSCKALQLSNTTQTNRNLQWATNKRNKHESKNNSTPAA